MKRELDEIDGHLFNEIESKGPKCVLLHCLSGGGKTHLAREYVYSNKDKFPGGVFWVRAKSWGDLETGFWDIAAAVALHDQNRLNREAFSRLRENNDSTASHMVPVKQWLESQKGWLLVFDGLTIEYDAELDDFRKYIPYSPNNSIIYTTRDQTLADRKRLLHPIGIAVGELSPDEACDLLLRELRIPKKPLLENDKNDVLMTAKELAGKMHYLPRRIHLSAEYITGFKVPLKVYNADYGPEPTQQDLKNYQITIMDLQHWKHKGAINLMNILCFFDQHIP
jgi:NB-ARC domain